MKWLINLLLVFSMLVLQSCGNEEISIPEDVIDKERMAEILADVQLVESTIIVRGDDEKLQNDSLDFYGEVYKRHNIKPGQFERSMKFYSLHPSILEEIYSEVIVTISERLAQLEGTQESDSTEAK